MALEENIQAYFRLKNLIRQELTTVHIDSLNAEFLSILRELLKDVGLETAAFELMLKLNPAMAKEHLESYYLEGEPETKMRFKGNLDIMLDDYRVILGEEAFAKLIGALPASTREHPAIKHAIAFARDDSGVS